MVTSCLHPWAAVAHFYSEPAQCYECSGSVDLRFTYCQECNEVLEGEIPNPIPLDWEDDARKVATKVTGYPLEEPPPPFVGPPTWFQHEMNGIYASMFDQIVRREFEQAPLVAWLKETK